MGSIEWNIIMGVLLFIAVGAFLQMAGVIP